MLLQFGAPPNGENILLERNIDIINVNLYMYSRHKSKSSFAKSDIYRSDYCIKQLFLVACSWMFSELLPIHKNVISTI